MVAAAVKAAVVAAVAVKKQEGCVEMCEMCADAAARAAWKQGRRGASRHTNLALHTLRPPGTSKETATLPMVNSCSKRFFRVAAVSLYKMGNVVLPRNVRKNNPPVAAQRRRWISLRAGPVVGSSPEGQAAAAQL